MRNPQLKQALVYAGCSMLFVVAVATGSMVFIVHAAFSDMCGNTVWKKAKHPVSDSTAFLFERNCGATTGFSTQISIVDGDRLPDDGGNVLVLDGYYPDMDIEWQGANVLVVSNMPTICEVFHKAVAFEGAQIEYRTQH